MVPERLPRSALPPVLGLTGAPGAGKSALASIWAGLGCAVIDVDGIGRDELGRAAVRREIAAVFGRTALDPGGAVDRAALARIVFADDAARRRLEGIVHPGVLARVRAGIEAARREAPRAVVLDCALLFEGGLDALCDATVAVHAPRALRLRRVAARGWTAADLEARERAQLPAAEKRRRAGHALDNGGGEDALRRAASALLDRCAPARRAEASPTRVRTRTRAGRRRPAARSTR